MRYVFFVNGAVDPSPGTWSFLCVFGSVAGETEPRAGSG